MDPATPQSDPTLAELLAVSHLDKKAIDGLCFASFTLSPDTAVGLTQHLDVSLRWKSARPRTPHQPGVLIGLVGRS